MKTRLLVVMAAILIAPAVAFCAEHGPEDMDRQMERRNMEMEIQEREAQIGFQRELQEMELQQRRMELERQRDQMRPPDARRRMDTDRARAAMVRPAAPVNRARGKAHPMLPLLMMVCFVVHILTAIWVFTDIRTRGCGSGIWVVIALLTGLCGTLVYAVVRLGDISEAKNNGRKKA